MVMADDEDDSDNNCLCRGGSPKEPDNQGSRHNANTQNMPTSNELPKNSAEGPIDYISLMKNVDIFENIQSLNPDKSKGQILEQKHNAKITTKDFSRNSFDTNAILEEFALRHYLTTDNEMLPEQDSTFIPNEGNQNPSLELEKLLDALSQPQTNPYKPIFTTTANRRTPTNSNSQDPTFPPVQNGNQIQHVQAEDFGQTMNCTQEAVACEFNANIPKTGQMPNFPFESELACKASDPMNMPPINTPYPPITDNVMLPKQNYYKLEHGQLLDSPSRPQTNPNTSISAMHRNPRDTTVPFVYNGNQIQYVQTGYFEQTMTCSQEGVREFSTNIAKTGQMHNFPRPESSCRVPDLQANPYPSGPAGPVYPQHQSVNPASNYNLNGSKEGPMEIPYLNPQHQPMNPTFNNNLNGSMDMSHFEYNQSKTTCNQNYAQSQSINFFMNPQNQKNNNFANPQLMNHFFKSERGGDQTDMLPSNAQHQNMNPTSYHQQNGQSEALTNRPSFGFQPIPQSRMPPYSTYSTGYSYPSSPYPSSTYHNSQTGVSMTNSVWVPGNYGSQADNKSSITTRYLGYTDEQKQEAAYLESLRSQSYLGTATKNMLRTSFHDNNTPTPNTTANVLASRVKSSNNVNAGLAGRPYPDRDTLYPIPRWLVGYQHTVTKKEAVKTITKLEKSKAQKKQEIRAPLRHKQVHLRTTTNMDLIQNTNTNITPNIMPGSLSTQAHKQTVNMGICSTQSNIATRAQNINTINKVQVSLDGGNQSIPITMTVNNSEVLFHLMEDCTQQKIPTMDNKAANIEKTLINIQNNGEQIPLEQDMSVKHNEQTKIEPSVIKATTNTITEHVQSEACVQQSSSNMDIETALALMHADTEEGKTNVTHTSKTQVQSTTTVTTIMYQKETLVDILTDNATKIINAVNIENTLLPQAKTNHQIDQDNNEDGNQEKQSKKRRSVSAEDAPSKNPESQYINTNNVSDNVDTNHENHSKEKEIIQPSGSNSLNDETTVSENENLLNRKPTIPPIKLKLKRPYYAVDNSNNNNEEPCNLEINVASNNETDVNVKGAIDDLNNCFKSIKANSFETVTENIREVNDDLPEVKIPGKKKKTTHNGHGEIPREYTCCYCGYFVKSLRSVERHLKKNHQIANIKKNDFTERLICRHCNYDKYLTKKQYLKHIENYHNDIFTNPGRI